MAKVPNDPPTKADKWKRPAGKRPAEAGAAEPDAPRRRAVKPDRTRPVPPGERPADAPPSAGNTAPATPVMIRADSAAAAVSLPASAGSGPARRKSDKRPSARRQPRQTFLVAATLTDADGGVSLGVYAVLTRTPAEALGAVRDWLGTEVPVGLTGKLSGRMAKALELRPGQVHRL